MVFGGIEREHQVEHHFVHLLGTAVRLVHLVDHHYRFQSDFQCLLQHETCLGHGTFESIDQKDATVCHIQHTFHLAAEVGVSRRVNDINLCTLIIDRDVLGENRDTSFTLQFIVIQNQVASLLILTKEISGEQHLIDQRRLSVVHVRNNRNVSNVLHKVLSCKIGCKGTKKLGVRN